MKIVWLGVAALVLGGCIPPSLYTAEDKRALAYYEHHTPGSRLPDDAERLSPTDVILNGLQVCKALETYPEPEQALANFVLSRVEYTPDHRRIIFATGVHGYCPEHEDKLQNIGAE